MAKQFWAKLLRSCTIAVITAYAPSPHIWHSPGSKIRVIMPLRPKFLRPASALRYGDIATDEIREEQFFLESAECLRVSPLTGSAPHKIAKSFSTLLELFGRIGLTETCLNH